MEATSHLHTLAEWHEDHGDVLWWKFPVDEPPYIGSPLADEWPGYHTHWEHIHVPAPPMIEQPDPTLLLLRERTRKITECSPEDIDGKSASELLDMIELEVNCEWERAEQGAPEALAREKKLRLEETHVLRRRVCDQKTQLKSLNHLRHAEQRRMHELLEERGKLNVMLGFQKDQSNSDLIRAVRDASTWGDKLAEIAADLGFKPGDVMTSADVRPAVAKLVAERDAERASNLANTAELGQLKAAHEPLLALELIARRIAGNGAITAATIEHHQHLRDLELQLHRINSIRAGQLMDPWERERLLRSERGSDLASAELDRLKADHQVELNRQADLRDEAIRESVALTCALESILSDRRGDTKVSDVEWASYERLVSKAAGKDPPAEPPKHLETSEPLSDDYLGKAIYRLHTMRHSPVEIPQLHDLTQVVANILDHLEKGSKR